MYDVPARPAWQREALCRGIDVELFFPTRGKNSVARESIRRACGACPVRGQCIELANALPEHFGMFGGTSERQRLVLRRRGVLRMADGAVVTMDATTRAVSVTKPRGEVMTRYGARLLLESLDTRRRPLAATG